MHTRRRAARHRATATTAIRPASRFLRTIAAGSTAAIVGTTLAVTTMLGASAAIACPPAADYKNLHNGTIVGTDNNVNVYAGGDFTALAGAAEAEGVIVVTGDATFSTSYYNLGLAGVGSRVTPTPGSDMLITGGSITVTSGTLAVGDGIGGNIVAGGTVTGAHVTSGGTVTQNSATALDPYADMPARITQASADYAALTPTGTVSAQPWVVEFIGDGVSATQVFEVSGTLLGTMASPTTHSFAGIPANATVIINVTGATAVVSGNSTSLNGTEVNPMSTTDFTFSDLTQRMLWNFPDATSVTLGKSSQLLGSVLIPNPASHASVQTSTNGRFLSNGSITQGGAGVSGLEFHSFPFRGTNGCTIPELVAQTGGFSVTKLLVNSGSLSGTPASYPIEYSTNGGTSWVTLNVAAGTTETVAGLPAGTTVQFREAALSAVTGGNWATPVWSDDTITIVADETEAVSVTNTLTPVPAPTGGFEVSKVVVNDDSIVGLPSSYPIEYSTDAGASWTALPVTPGTPSSVSGLPVGTVVQLREASLTAIPGATWLTPVWTTSSVTIVANATQSATVTNEIESTPVAPTTGEFTVTKTLVNPDAVTALPATYPIEYSIDGGASWTSLPLAAGASETVTGIPAGTVVQLREGSLPTVTDATWQTPTWSSTTLTIVAGATASATVTNRIESTPFVPPTGGFEITKTLVNSDNVAGVPTSFLVEYSLDGGASWQSLPVTAGSAATVGGLDAGTTVLLREATLPAVAGATWATPVWSTTTLTIVADDTVSSTVTNTITADPVVPAAGGFTITKAVQNPDSVANLPPTYVVEYRIDGGAWTALTVTPGTPATVSNVAAGSSVELREVAPAAIAGATWRAPVWSGAGTAFTVTAGSHSAVGLENGIDADPVVPAVGSFSLSKILENPDALSNLPSDYTLEYSLNGSTTWTPVQLAAGATVTVPNVPVGTTVRVREVAPSGVAGGTWAAEVWDTQTLVVAGAPTVVSATVTNRITATPVAPTPGFSTVAWVNNDGVTKLLPITGGTVTDRISYTGLTPGVAYRFDGWLMRADGGAGTPIGVTSSATFTPTAADGDMTMDWIISPAVAAANAGHRIVIYLELFEVGDPVAIADDLDINNPTEWFEVAAAVTPNPGPDTGSDPSGNGGLALTGAAVGPLAALAALLAVLGLGALAVARRRRAHA